MQFLIDGAGVIGSIYAGLLQEAGHAVTVLARGERLAQVRDQGIRLLDEATGRRTSVSVQVVGGLAPGDRYDWIIVALPGHKAASAMPPWRPTPAPTCCYSSTQPQAPGNGRKRSAQSDSADPDSSRIWWDEGGVHQNITFPVQPDPISGAHCWHPAVRLSKPAPQEAYADLAVDTAKSRQAFRRWLEITRPAAASWRCRCWCCSSTCRPALPPAPPW